MTYQTRTLPETFGVLPFSSNPNPPSPITSGATGWYQAGAVIDPDWLNSLALQCRAILTAGEQNVDSGSLLAALQALFAGASASPAGRFLGTTTFRNASQSGTVWTPRSATTFAVLEMGGAGGAGGGTALTGANQVSVGSGGGSGAFVRCIINSPSATTITVGAGGTGVSGSNGNNGGTTSFGSDFNVSGGYGGTGAVSATLGNSAYAGQGVGGLVINASNIISSGHGSQGTCGIIVGSTIGITTSGIISGFGGNSMWGGGGPNTDNGNGSNAYSPSSGGGAAGANINQSAYAGGNGSDGIIIISEYS